MIVRRVLLIALCGLTLAGARAAQAGDPPTGDLLPFKAAEKTLPNGLRVIVVPTGFPNIVSLQIPVQVGSRNEVEPGKSGFAHFFEHMMFRGTRAYPPEAYSAIMTKAGARQNAYTSDDLTNYHVTFAKEDLEKILEVEADRFQNLQYTEEAFKTEARAVLGEYNKNSANPVRRILEAQRKAGYTTHPYRHTTMGFIEDIENMPNQFEYSRAFFTRWYRPEKTTLVVAGDVDPERVFGLVDRYWGNWRRGDYRAEIPREPERRGPVYTHVAWPSPTLPWVAVAFHGPSLFQWREQAAMDAAIDLAFGETSELFKRLVQREQKVDQMFAFGGPNVDPTLFTVFARVKNPADAVYARDRMLETFAGLRREPLDVRRVADAKSNARYAFVRGLDNTDAIAAAIARAAHFERSYATTNRYYRELAAVDPAAIQETARKYFTDRNLVVTTLAQQPLDAAIARAPSLETLAAPAPNAAASLRIVEQKSMLPNVMFKLLFTVGSAADPAGKGGLAMLAARMIAEAGSTEMRVDEINRALYPMAGEFGGQVDKEMTTFTGVVHREQLDRYLDIVLPRLLSPGYRAEDFQRLKDQQRNALEQDLRGNNEEELGKEELQNRVFAGTPYGHTPLGTLAGIEAITLDDVKAFIAHHYKASNVVVGLSGDYPAALRDRLATAVGKLGRGAAAAPRAALEPFALRAPRGLEVEIVKKQTRATAISLGHPITVTRADPDFAALNLARVWLGEHRSSTGRLYDRIREARGLNYGDYAYIEHFGHPGLQFYPSPNLARRNPMFEIWIRPVVPRNAPMALRLALYETQRMIDEGISERDFENTRGYLLKNVYLLTSTQSQRLGYALDSWWYGMGDYVEEMRARYARLTREEVNRAIKKHLSTRDLHVVIVTQDAEGLRDTLVAGTPSSVQYDAPKPELAAEDRVIGAYQLGIRFENVRIVDVDAIFAR